MLTTFATTLIAALPLLQGGDSILLTDGKVLTDLRVTSETYKEVSFRRGTVESRRSADSVAEVRHDLSSGALEDYRVAVELMDREGDFAAAAARFGAVLEDDVVERFDWVRQHAMWRRVRCLNGLGDYRAMAREVDALLGAVPDTFFYAPALLMKAQGLVSANDKPGARKVFEQLDADVSAKGLPERWAREAELGLALLDDSGNAEAKKRKLEGLAEKNAESYPTVADRARVEVGNVMVEAGDYKGARAFFQRILDSGNADMMTMAAALSGIGDCAFEQGKGTTDAAQAKAFYEEAALAHLQVASYYREVARLRPRSICFAGASIYHAGGEGAVEESRDVARKALQLYPNSPWTARLFEELGLEKP